MVQIVCRAIHLPDVKEIFRIIGAFVWRRLYLMEQAKEE